MGPQLGAARPAGRRLAVDAGRRRAQLRCWLTVTGGSGAARLLQRARPAVLPGRDGPRPGHAGDQARHGRSLGGVSYLAFLAPGLLAASAMRPAMGESTYPVFGSVKWNKIYHAALASPLRPATSSAGTCCS